MSRYTGSKTKLSRRVGKNLYLKGARSFSAKDDYTKKQFVTKGKSRRRPRLSEYGKQLKEKQTLRFTYGVTEKQLASIFKKAFKRPGDTGQIALTNLEMRLDNVVYRGGLANSRSQARQLVNHGHFLVNGIKSDIPSMLLTEGDIVTVKPNKLEKSNFWKEFQLEIPKEKASWIDSTKKHTIKVLSSPTNDDLPTDLVHLPTIVEFYSRKVA